MKERAVGVRAALPVVLATEVVAIGAFIGLTPARFGWWPAAAITAAAFVLMVVTVYRRNLPGWIAALMRWRSRRRGREQAAAAVDVTQGNLVCGVRVDAYEAITMVQITGRPYRPTFLRGIGGVADHERGAAACADRTARPARRAETGRASTWCPRGSGCAAAPGIRRCIPRCWPTAPPPGAARPG